MIKAKNNARVFHDASGTMDDRTWRMLSIGKEIGMLMLDMYYDLGDMECTPYGYVKSSKILRKAH